MKKNFSKIEKIMTTFSIPKKMFQKIESLICVLPILNIKGKRSWKDRGPAMTVIPIIWHTNKDMNGNISFFCSIMEILVLTKTRALLDKEKRHHMLDINVR